MPPTELLECGANEIVRVSENQQDDSNQIFAIESAAFHSLRHRAWMSPYHLYSKWMQYAKEVVDDSLCTNRQMFIVRQVNELYKNIHEQASWEL